VVARSAAHRPRKVAPVTLTFGIFDHIEDIPGTPTHQLFRDRLELAKLADDAGFTSFHLAEHHGSALCMSPTQEIFVAAASQVTTNLRLGPMVKLLPLHHPVQILEDMCAVDQLTGGRLDFGVGRGVSPIEHAWFGSKWTESRERFEDTLGIICHAFASGEISSTGSVYHDFPTVPLSTKPLQDPIPFWYPGNPVVAGRHGMSLMCAGAVPQSTRDAYLESWEAHRADTLRLDGPHSEPRIGLTLILAIAPSEKEALEISRRGVDGLVRRTKAVHSYDHLVLSPADCARALKPLEAILSHIEATVTAGAGVPEQIGERLSAVLETGLVDHISLQVPTGDMTYAEARRTVELFASEVKPELERRFAA
jgi:alkanesulfonate monooxygenase SsuD/methylene tetrahydromethanopterin reductase-like flavin-dependent oxidoreductase (luciferase family)